MVMTVTVNGLRDGTCCFATLPILESGKSMKVRLYR